MNETAPSRERNGSGRVVVGAGPLGLAVVRQLRRNGELVRMVTRGGRADVWWRLTSGVNGFGRRLLCDATRRR